MSTLLAVSGPNIGIKYSLTNNTTRIGRGPENDIQIQDHSVSRFHCEIIKKGRSFSIRDLDSRNGILINGQRLSEKVLLRNDRLDIGNSTFLFDSDYDLKNTRFSNKLVYLSPPQDETIQDQLIEQKLVERRQDHFESFPALQALLELFAAPTENVPQLMQQALDSIMKFSRAERGCVLLWDEVTSELQPMVASAKEDELALNHQALQLAFKEKQAILTSNHNVDLRYFPSKDTATHHSALCIPLLFKGESTGVLFLERLQLNRFKLEDVHQLQLMANVLAAATVHLSKPDQSSGVPPDSENEILGKSTAFVQVMDQVKKIAKNNSSVLITGETGTGKELIARAIHRDSPRAKFPFVAVNCAAIPESLFESELFGHERGAFTGADRMAIGKIESAHGGTLFLDEVGELSLGVQPKLLRFLQEKAFYRVGGTKPVSVDVRILGATNISLQQAVREKKFREDLYYRLQVITIEMPPLRERRSDILILAESFAQRHARRYGRRFLGFSDEAVVLMERYAWPGNVRELENAVERAVLLSDSGVLDSDYLVPAGGRGPFEKAAISEKGLPTMREMEEQLIRLAMKQCGGNQAKAAELLKVHRNTIRNKIQEFGINLTEPD